MDDLFKAPNNLMVMLFTLSLESKGNVFPSFDKPVNSRQWHFFFTAIYPFTEGVFALCLPRSACMPLYLKKE